MCLAEDKRKASEVVLSWVEENHLRIGGGVIQVEPEAADRLAKALQAKAEIHFGSLGDQSISGFEIQGTRTIDEIVDVVVNCLIGRDTETLLA